jgi:hypothetical protein
VLEAVKWALNERSMWPIHALAILYLVNLTILIRNLIKLKNLWR